MSRSLAAKEIDRLLPQTQCTMCGYPRCWEYALAIANQETHIDRCPPGGISTINALADLLQMIAPESLAEDCDTYLGRHFAQIEENNCIGCTLCIDACPTDAIIGAAKHMHTVLVNECTGCRLCLDYCPVDCIVMIENPLKSEGGIWDRFRDDEVNRWRDLTERQLSRKKQNVESSNPGKQHASIKFEILGAVNRERTKRWKQTKRMKLKD